jgi:putative membrane protein
MLIIMVLFFAAFLWVLVSLLGPRAHDHHHGAPGPHDAHPGPQGSDAVRILDERFAKGEIDADEYQQRRDLLRNRP